ncbi:MAG: electron transfer flavoprotein subunit beta/FixA family protein [Desulfobacterales bacterium]|nr:electron transfer flavoprotein subunit beta/FixA family protein [Desulfobacterales bacterium]
MEIIVLVKQVPATDFAPEIDETGVSVRTEDVNWVMNPYDELAVEEALRIREARGGRVTLVSAGPERVLDTLRTGLAMGADEAILISDPALPTEDAMALSQVLTAAVAAMPCDLVIAGMRAVDDDGYTVGPAVAQGLGIGCITEVIRQEITDGRIRCHRTVEGGTVVLETDLPALITTQRGINDPRFTALSGIMKARKKEIPVRSLAEIGLSPNSLPAGRSNVVALRYPPERKGGRFIDGETPQEQARELVRLLHEEAKAI